MHQEMCQCTAQAVIISAAAAKSMQGLLESISHREHWTSVISLKHAERHMAYPLLSYICVADQPACCEPYPTHSLITAANVNVRCHQR